MLELQVKKQELDNLRASIEPGSSDVISRLLQDYEKITEAHAAACDMITAAGAAVMGKFRDRELLRDQLDEWLDLYGLVVAQTLPSQEQEGSNP